MTTVYLDADYITGDVTIEATTYGNGTTALLLVDEYGERLGVATVALDEVPAAGNVYVKSWSENAGLLEALQRAGVVGDVVREIPSGFVTVYEVPLRIAVGAGR